MVDFRLVLEVKKERKYAITESIHPGDKYCAVANADDYEIYFDNQALTDEEGRFELKDYKVYGYYKDMVQISKIRLYWINMRKFLWKE